MSSYENMCLQCACSGGNLGAAHQIHAHLLPLKGCSKSSMPQCSRYDLSMRWLLQQRCPAQLCPEQPAGAVRCVWH